MFGHRLQYTNFVLQGKGVCEPLMPNVVAPKAHQNNRSYVSSADLPLELPLDSMRIRKKNLHVTQRTLKTAKLSKLAGGHLPGCGCLPTTIW